MQVGHAARHSVSHLENAFPTPPLAPVRSSTMRPTVRPTMSKAARPEWGGRVPPPPLTSALAAASGAAVEVGFSEHIPEGPPRHQLSHDGVAGGGGGGGGSPLLPGGELKAAEEGTTPPSPEVREDAPSQYGTSPRASRAPAPGPRAHAPASSVTPDGGFVAPDAPEGGEAPEGAGGAGVGGAFGSRSTGRHQPLREAAEACKLNTWSVATQWAAWTRVGMSRASSSLNEATARRTLDSAAAHAAR
mmetsp:Transcript_18162/g.41532  ORF Transcript_18162/g.41532 Transcript_18162/m.41532 type:complete len:246 (-) Transcript_18162:771-1508(-)